MWGAVSHIGHSCLSREKGCARLIDRSTPPPQKLLELHFRRTLYFVQGRWFSGQDVTLLSDKCSGRVDRSHGKPGEGDNVTDQNSESGRAEQSNTWLVS